MAKPRFNTQMIEVPKICEFEVSALMQHKDLLAFFLSSKIQECIEGCYICIKIVLWTRNVINDGIGVGMNLLMK
jgi:hypothetical protein